jgi:hypothetical protein
VTIISYRLLVGKSLRKRLLERTTKDENQVFSAYLMEIYSVPLLIFPSKRKALWHRKADHSGISRNS